MKGQLTIRGVVIGVIGCVVITAASIYTALKMGALPWPIIFAAVVSLFFLRAFGSRSLNEANVTHTIMSAGAMVAGGLAFTIPGIWILGLGETSFAEMLLVALAGTLLGLVASAYLRRLFIDEQELEFPIGRAAAETLVAGDKGGRVGLKLFTSMGLAGLWAALRSLGAVPAMILNGLPLTGVTFGIYMSPMMVSVGFLVGTVAMVAWFAGALWQLVFVAGGTAAGLMSVDLAQAVNSSLGMGVMMGCGLAVVCKDVLPRGFAALRGKGTGEGGGGRLRGLLRRPASFSPAAADQSAAQEGSAAGSFQRRDDAERIGGDGSGDCPAGSSFNAGLSSPAAADQSAAQEGSAAGSFQRRDDAERIGGDGSGDCPTGSSCGAGSATSAGEARLAARTFGGVAATPRLADSDDKSAVQEAGAAGSSRKRVSTGLLALLAAALAYVGCVMVGVGPLASVLVVAFAFVTVAMSAQSVGQTGIDPMEIFGLIVLLIVAFIGDTPQVQLFFVAGIIAVACGLGGDVMNDFKAGALLGTNSRAQVAGQAIGGIVGAVVAAVSLYALVGAYGPEAFGVGKDFVAAQANVVATLVAGVPCMPAFLAGLVIGFVVYCLRGPAMMIGLGIYLPFYMSLTAFLGCLLKLLVDFITRRRVAAAAGAGSAATAAAVADAGAGRDAATALADASDAGESLVQARADLQDVDILTGEDRSKSASGLQESVAQSGIVIASGVLGGESIVGVIMAILAVFFAL